MIIQRWTLTAVNAMVSSLDTDKINKEKYRKTLLKFEKELFGGRLGKLNHCKSVHIKLKLGIVSYKGR